MSRRDVFEKYLQYRYERANAITPGQRLEVLEEVKADARRGMVPIDENSLASLDLKDPAVQAVLRGENVSMGNSAATKKRTRLPNSERNKVLIVTGILVVPILLALLFLGMRGRARAAANVPTPTAAALPTATIDPVFLAQQTLESQASLTETALAAAATPTLVPTETPSPQEVLYSSGVAASEPGAPASIEIAGRRLVVLEGSVDSKSGVWEPGGGVEWLKGTFVRKVFAVPLELLKDAQLTTGDPINVRYRNGYTVTFALTQATSVVVDQIEILNSNKPSVVILAYTNNLEEPKRLVLLGEIPVPFQAQAGPEPTPIPGMRAIVIGDGVRLRLLPSLSSATLSNLPIGMEVLVSPGVQQFSSDGLQWVYVQSPLGSGWVAKDLLTILR